LIESVGVHTFDSLDEDGEVVDGDALAAHPEFWGPVWEVDGFGDESGDVWGVNRSGQRDVLLYHMCYAPVTYLGRMSCR